MSTRLPYLSQGQQEQASFFAKWTMGAILLFLTFVSLNIKVIIRTRFGERHLDLVGVGTVLMIYVGVLLMVQQQKVLEALGNFEILDSVVLFYGLFSAAFAAYIYHHVQIWRRNRRGERIHSRYWGDSYLAMVLPFFTPVFTKRIVEPIAVCLVGLIFVLVVEEVMFGGYVAIAGVAMLIEGLINWYQIRTRLLDYHDAYLESTALVGLLDPNARAENHKGVMLVEGLPKTASSKERETIVTIAQAASPAYQALHPTETNGDPGDAKTRAVEVTSRMSDDLQALVTNPATEASPAD